MYARCKFDIGFIILQLLMFVERDSHYKQNLITNDLFAALEWCNSVININNQFCNNKNTAITMLQTPILASQCLNQGVLFRAWQGHFSSKLIKIKIVEN